MADDRYDLIVVGSGPGGASLAHRKGHRSGTLGDQPAHLMTVRLHVGSVQSPCHLK